MRNHHLGRGPTYLFNLRYGNCSTKDNSRWMKYCITTQTWEGSINTLEYMYLKNEFAQCATLSRKWRCLCRAEKLFIFFIYASLIHFAWESYRRMGENTINLSEYLKLVLGVRFLSMFILMYDTFYTDVNHLWKDLYSIRYLTLTLVISSFD